MVATASHGLGATGIILHAATASGDERVVRRAYGEALELAASMRVANLAIPALGCGTGGLAVERSAELLREALRVGSAPAHVICVLYDGPTADVFARVLDAR